MDSGSEPDRDDTSDAVIDQATSDSPVEDADRDHFADGPDGDTGSDGSVPDGPPDGEAGDAPDAAPDGELSDGGTESRDAWTASGCDPRAPFQTITPLNGLADAANPDASTDYDDITARLSPNELNLYFASDRTGMFTLYRGSRTTTTAPFTNIEVIPDVSDLFTSSPAVTADEQTMYMESNRSGRRSIYVSTRSGVEMAWPVPVSLAAEGAFGQSVADGGPYILPDGSVLYFHSDRTGDNNSHIYRAQRVGNGFPSAVQVANTVSAINWEVQPVVAADDLTLYFASDRTGVRAQGGWDIWVSRRQTTSDLFESPTNVVELNTGEDEFPGWISPDSCHLYFERRVGTIGHTFVASRREASIPQATDGGVPEPLIKAAVLAPLPRDRL